eukprot:5860781-Amphidinium_carterae.1
MGALVCHHWTTLVKLVLSSMAVSASGKRRAVKLCKASDAAPTQWGKRRSIVELYVLIILGSKKWENNMTSLVARGIAHVLEHSVLCGSRKYPVKEQAHAC